MIKKSRAERRQYPRIEQRLPIKLAANGYDFATSTQNVSCVGAYCRVTKYMPPFTKVLVKLTLPVVTENGNKNYSVECKGVVVRTEDESRGGFNIAVFFNQINGEEKKKISEYISQFLPKEPAVANRL
jgi:hypothetical protein